MIQNVNYLVGIEKISEWNQSTQLKVFETRAFRPYQLISPFQHTIYIGQAANE